ncbi:ras protein Rab 26 [Trichuris trichiura]|uniref:Ras protein Rab 26 n=1 Tax=Trichuris trichiura TaxID=36087 RepID=A0A077Z726_TRITR|nr:ras protein Rab 26 [Trichuris trichiura]
MMVGDCSVGKTCLLMRFAEGKFESEKYVTTIGIDYSSKVVQVGDVKVKLQVWDTAGQERFRSLTKAYYRDSDCLLLLFDLTNPDSFHSCGQWLDDIRKYSPERSSVFLVGCKADLQDNRQIKFEVAKRLANAYNLMYFETSSRTGENVELLFDVIARYDI